ncbi:chaperonin 10-like protein, partial [Suillus occidentalis]
MPEGTMRALWYNKRQPQDFEIKQVPIPKVGDDDVLLKGVCGTDGHIHEGEFISKFPLIPGHEAIGKVVEMGKDVKGFEIGDRCVADVGLTCDNCFYCRRGNSLLCENFNARGVTLDGGFAEYIVYHQKKLYKIKNLTDEESTLLEPAAFLLLGAGSTGLILAQLLKLNGASRVVIAANKGIKMDIARQLEAGDEYIELDRQNPDAQWQKLKDDNPYG